MYLSAKHVDAARTIVTNFEVAYRGYISEKLLQDIKTSLEFQTKLSQIITTLSSSTAILSGYLKSKATNIKGKHGEVFEDLEFSRDCFIKKSIYKNHDVPDVSEIISITYLFTDLYKPLILTFKSSTEFIQLSNLYHDKRNKLSHTGSELLDEEDMLNVICFISQVMDYLSDDYFWYKSKQDIQEDIETYLSINNQSNIYGNMSDMPFANHKIICREDQLDKINDFISLQAGQYKKATTLCIYGYGGIGKTALALEYVRKLIKDVNDKKIQNPVDNILFFSAKDIMLTTNDFTGKIDKLEIQPGFKSCAELKAGIFSHLKISSFDKLNSRCLVIVDNFESLQSEEKANVRKLIKNGSPPSISYIVTSRNPEPMEEMICIQEFTKETGIDFVNKYIHETGIDVVLSEKDKASLVDLSRGNTLVLVLCLHRLNSKNATLGIIKDEFNELVSLKKIKKELSEIPPNAYEIISEFMYRNTFNDITQLLSDKSDLLLLVLKIFAVIDSNTEVYTLSRLTNRNFRELEDILDILCNFLILQKVGEYYSINQFANKYVVDMFISDSVEFEEISCKVSNISKTIKSDLRIYQQQLKKNPDIQSIMNDWHIEHFGDRLSAAKAFSIYMNISRDLNNGYDENYYSIANDLMEINKLLTITIHPYLRVQKARILSQIRTKAGLSQEKKDEEKSAYLEAIQIIKWNYPQIKATKSYAATLWFYGIFLYDTNNDDAVKYLEEAKKSFEKLSIFDSEYYKCLSYLGFAYLSQYEKTQKKEYLRLARYISYKLKADYKKYDRSIQAFSIQLENDLRKYGTFSS